MIDQVRSALIDLLISGELLVILTTVNHSDKSLSAPGLIDLLIRPLSVLNVLLGVQPTVE